ncbi:predicted protein [Nematostella vectensis]|uniref:Uncharacterized protein n=2 Tax=Nematostella vectensis TaxID=45351 RepID=A7S4G6_NEMVE|nr:glucocorticoid-induced transcript 1 protein isoform X2 [Nematostella vectensis]XP_032238585.1 glucocorticoid-induced transcript 1 protein isoform X2 [Nematostella vectensis]EDO41409.1 predicted protein [Nematostella vectensis]|eukprot:XP_001633472.1 predicted protein [Nematostella vectensis]
MASQPSRPRRNNSPSSSSRPQPLRATHPFSLLRNPSPTRGNPIRRPSPSSSPVHGNETGLKPKRTSPETRGSPEHRRSPTSPSPNVAKCKVERPKPLKAGSTSSFTQLRRTSSLDAISGTYLSGQWPRANETSSYGPLVCHKSTQTPTWDESEIDEPSYRPKRSNSWSSADHMREKLRQQRIKQGSNRSPSYGRQSPLHGDHAIQKATQSVAIPIPKITRSSEGHQRRSLEELNTEIQKLVLRPGDDPAEVKLIEPVDGRKAPIPDILSIGSPFPTVDMHTQTQAENQDSQESSRSHSASPCYPIMAGTTDSKPPSRCSSGEGPTMTDSAPTDGSNGIENASADESTIDPPSSQKYASSPKPNKSYTFAREPPDGAEKVPLYVEDNESFEKPSFTGPDKTKVKIIFSNGSAFSALPSIPKMAITPSAAHLQTIPTMEPSQ